MDRSRIHGADRVEIDRARDDRDRDSLRDELGEEHVAAFVPEVEIEQHDIDALGHLSARLVERARFAYLVAAKLEIHPAEQANRWLVVDHENDVSRAPCRHKAAVYPRPSYPLGQRGRSPSS